MANIKVEGDDIFKILSFVPNWCVPNKGETIIIENKKYFVEDKNFDLSNNIIILKVQNVCQ